MSYVLYVFKMCYSQWLLVVRLPGVKPDPQSFHCCITDLFLMAAEVEVNKLSVPVGDILFLRVLPVGRKADFLITSEDEGGRRDI
jgi:hypothetical protein